ncbi:serine hydrolase domain-containing protein [Streptomyces rimosus]|uniref:serine hydrolase domain-containing protein n=1 Tax=Streptomyces rimosus TaxID=1927 RepID=UPI000518525E|nr:serine hydrolase domain-containing protein [Streptomyces rimosus]
MLQDIAAVTEHRVAEMLNRHSVGGLALGVVRDGRVEHFVGHGFADLAARTPISEDTAFRIASISKTFTAIAVMQLWERGLVDLDAPAGSYLKAFRLSPAKAGFRPATLRHLLTHTAGIGELRGPGDLLRANAGEGVKPGRPLPSLAEYYRRGLRVDAEPGTQWTYANHGFATLGQIVEDVSGEPFDRYLRERVFTPWGMNDTDLVRSERIRGRLATGYELRARGLKAVTDRERTTPGASSVCSTTRDMARYVSALLNGGTNAHGSAVKHTTLATMFAPHYQPDPRVPGMGLAFFRGEADGHRFVEHQGILPGFTSQLFVAPDDGIAVIALTNAAHRALLWLPAETEALLRQLIGLPEQTLRTDVPQRPEVWGELCGWYTLAGRITDVRARAMAGSAAEVFVRSGRLMLRSLTPVPTMLRGIPLCPDDENDPYVFRIDLSRFGIGKVRVVFGRDSAAGSTELHFVPIPLSMRKMAASRRRS